MLENWKVVNYPICFSVYFPVKFKFDMIIEYMIKTGRIFMWFWGMFNQFGKSYSCCLFFLTDYLSGIFRTLHHGNLHWAVQFQNHVYISRSQQSLTANKFLQQGLIWPSWNNIVWMLLSSNQVMCRSVKEAKCCCLQCLLHGLYSQSAARSIFTIMHKREQWRKT